MKLSTNNPSNTKKQQDLINEFKSKLIRLTNLKATNEFKQLNSELDEIKHWIPLVLEQIFNLDFWIKKTSSLNTKTSIDDNKTNVIKEDLDLQLQYGFEKWEALIDNLIELTNKMESINTTVNSIKDITSIFEQKLTSLGQSTKNVKNCPYKH